MKKSFISLFALFFIAGTFFCSCSDKNNRKQTAGTKNEATLPNVKTIGFSIDTLAIERWQRDLDVFMNKVKEMNANVIVQNAGNSLEEQNRQLMYLLDKGVDVIVVLPKEADGITESIQKIKNRNIPVISYDRLTQNADIDLYITINSEKVGEEMARGLIKTNSGNNWYCILGAQEDYNMALIQNGVNNVIKHTNKKINYTYYTSGWNYDLAHQEMIRLIKNDDIPDAIICGNDAIADSVIQALDLYYKGPSISICGQDADIAACQNIIAGKQSFTVYKPITQLAEMTAEIAVNIANNNDISSFLSANTTINNGQKDVPVVWLDPVTVNKNNIDEVVIESGFHTYGEVYR
ncbi:MAG: substrate-binding domain-containing protein [Treponema sp.]|nr:substrate-binding domain-containing protein [Treponema sp.]